MSKQHVPEVLGMSALAQMYWCHQYFIFKSIRDEEGYGKLADQLVEVPGGILHVSRDEYVYLPRSKVRRMRLDDFNSALAEVGYKASTENFKGEREKALAGECRHWIEGFGHPEGHSEVLFLYKRDSIAYPLTEEQFAQWQRVAPNITFWRDGPLTIDHAPDLSPEEEERLWRDEGATDAMIAGRRAERDHAEEYDGAQGLFEWRGYRIVGAPDGLADGFAYEFKSSRTDMLRRFQRSVAISQAQFYAYFFERPAIRVQLQSREADDILTIEQPLDTVRVEKDLRIADKLLRGEMGPWPPKAWKCRNCEFRERCPTAQP